MTKFDVAAAEDLVNRFYDARDEGMDHETGFDYAHPLADALCRACAYIHKLEAVLDAARGHEHCDYFPIQLSEALTALDQETDRG